MLRRFLSTEPSLAGRKFMIEVRDGKVSLSHLPSTLPGEARAAEYSFSLNEQGNNISSEAERIKEEILRDCGRPMTGALPG